LDEEEEEKEKEPCKPGEKGMKGGAAEGPSKSIFSYFRLVVVR
jgi:hypothetical protein